MAINFVNVSFQKPFIGNNNVDIEKAEKNNKVTGEPSTILYVSSALNDTEPRNECNEHTEQSHHLFSVKKKQGSDVLIDPRIEALIFEMGKLLGTETNILYDEISSKNNVLEPFKKYVSNQIGILDSGSKLTTFENYYYGEVKPDKKRLAQLELFTGPEKHNKYIALYTNKLINASGELLKQLLYIKLQQLVYSQEIALNEMKIIDDYLRLKIDSQQNGIKSSLDSNEYKWAKNLMKSNPTDAELMLDLIRNGQILLSHSLKAKELSKYSLIEETSNLLKDTPERLKALEHLYKLRAMSVMDDAFNFAPNKLYEHVQRIESEVDGLLKQDNQTISDNPIIINNASESIQQIDRIFPELENIVLTTCKEAYDQESKIINKLKIQNLVVT